MSKPVVHALSRRLALFSKALGNSLIVLLRLYQLLISPCLGSRCRFHPTCSSYAMDAIKTLGVSKGLYLTIKRLVRCHPGSPGGIDQVPSS